MNTTIADLMGKTMASVTGAVGEDEMIFTTTEGERFRFFHYQDCSETVAIEDIVGDLDDLVGSPLTMAEESMSGENPEGVEVGWQGSFTWTFYRFATAKGYVTVRWYGESNGHYSEDVFFERLPPLPPQLA